MLRSDRVFQCLSSASNSGKTAFYGPLERVTARIPVDTFSSKLVVRTFCSVRTIRLFVRHSQIIQSIVVSVGVLVINQGRQRPVTIKPCKTMRTIQPAIDTYVNIFGIISGALTRKLRIECGNTPRAALALSPNKSASARIIM